MLHKPYYDDIQRLLLSHHIEEKYSTFFHSEGIQLHSLYHRPNYFPMCSSIMMRHLHSLFITIREVKT